MKYLITGAAGFIGSNFLEYLNIVEPNATIDISDYLTNGKQFTNIVDLEWNELFHPDKIDVQQYDYVFHFGANSSTTEWDGNVLFEQNYNYTLELIESCNYYGVPIQYSSSASVYGNNGVPLNLYAFFKKCVDDKVMRDYIHYPIQGFRYFNVYGNNEDHKGNMASPYHKFTKQAEETGIIEIFEGSENFYRDFVDVDYVCEIQYMMMNKKSGIYDIGSGIKKSFYDVAKEIADKHNASIKYIPFPNHLKGFYQVNTEADMRYLNEVR